MPMPIVPARIVELGNQPSLWIDSREIRALAQIIVVACEGEIAQSVGAAVFPWNDVFNVQ
jgi:hypothetical protein